MKRTDADRRTTHKNYERGCSRTTVIARMHFEFIFYDFESLIWQ